MRHVGRQEIDEAADLDGLILDLETALRTGARERMVTPLRSLASNSERDRLFLTMPCYSEDIGLFTTKVGAIITADDPGKKSSVNTMVVAFDARSGLPIASLDGGAITYLKCAAVAALVTKHCTTVSATRLGLIGAGELARAQIIGLSRVRELSRVTMYSRSSSATEALASLVASKVGRSIEIRTASRIEDAVLGNDIVCTATTSPRPLVHHRWLGDVAHVNCMGARSPDRAEVDREALVSSVVVVEDVETAIQEGGPVHRDAFSLEAILGDGQDHLRTARTIFSSSGHGTLDLITTSHVLSRIEHVQAPRPHNRRRPS